MAGSLHTWLKGFDYFLIVCWTFFSYRGDKKVKLVFGVYQIPQAVAMEFVKPGRKIEINNNNDEKLPHKSSCYVQ
jgi:hypothetical protein